MKLSVLTLFSLFLLISPAQAEENQTPMLSNDEQAAAPVEVEDLDFSEAEKIDEVAPVETPKVAVSGGLTDAIASETQPTETWIDKLKTKASEGGDSLEGMVEKTKKKPQTRSNASVFDVSGLMLRMSLAQVEEIMKKHGFKKSVQKMDIPNFIKWRNEEGCRNEGVTGFERLESCVVDKSKKVNQQYVSSSTYVKYETKETIVINLTSNFTKNKVYKISYKSLSSTIAGNSPKATYIRNIKIYDFWKKVNQKYGQPDNKQDVTWGLGGNKPYMHAETGFLVLEDPMLRELDYTRMSREDQRYMNTDLYSF